MTTWFVSRHPGAIEWIKGEAITIDRWVEHLDVDLIMPGDLVIGTLPLMAAASVTAKGARFLALVLPQAHFDRGKEHSGSEMAARGAYLQEFVVHAL